jgi:hypothetical protein
MAAWERWLMALAGVMMVFPAIIRAATGDSVPAPHWIGLGLGVLLLVQQYARRRRSAPA